MLIVGALLAWILLTWDRVYDDVPAPRLEASTDPKVIEHGRYLVRGPAHCSICHMGSLAEVLRSDAGEELPLQGGLEFPIGPIVVLYPQPGSGCGNRNGRYTDGQLFRMLRHNVKPHGRASAPVDAVCQHGPMDIRGDCLVPRAGEPVRNEVPAPQWKFMGKAIAVLLRPAALQPVLGPLAARLSPSGGAHRRARTVSRPQRGQLHGVPLPARSRHRRADRS